MTTLEVQSQLPFEKLLDSLQQLDAEELDELTWHISQLRAQRRAGSLSEAEAALLVKINEGIVPLPLQRQAAALTEKARAGTISETEREQLVRVVDEIEQLNAQRLAYLAELARLRNMSLDALMEALELKPLSYE